MGVAGELQAVELRAGMRQLVAVNHARFVFLELEQTDEPFPLKGFAGVGVLELLEVGVEARLGVARQNALGDPLLECLGGAGVDVVRLVVGGLRLPLITRITL